MMPDVETLSTSSSSCARPLSSLDASDNQSMATSTGSRRARVKALSRKITKKAKKVLHIDDTEALVQVKANGAFDDIEGNPAFNPQHVFHERPVSVGHAVQQAKEGVKGAAYAVAHPKDSAKRKAAAKLATPEQPFLSERADKVLLEAHERLEEARKSVDSDESGAEDTEQLEEEVESLQAERESLRVAWTTSRFVHRVRVVPRKYIQLPRVNDFKTYDKDGQYLGIDWINLWGHYVLYATQHATTLGDDSADKPAFSRHILIEHVERILMASAPWQSYFLNLRKIWRWEDPKRTGKWLAIFTLLWLIDYVITFCICYSVFIILRNRYRQRSVESLRESHERAMDQGATAFKISELIHRHGSGHWLDPLIDEVGPRAQVQLRDLADYLETLQNFYDWKFPEKTWATLFAICAAIALGALTPTGYSMRIFTFVFIWWFFTGRPVASHYPRFRHVVSPVSYLFWDLPTHAQWSFRYLGVKAQAMRQRVVERTTGKENTCWRDSGVDVCEGLALDRGANDVDNANSSEHSAKKDREYSVAGPKGTRRAGDNMFFLTFRCRYHGVPGRLAIFDGGVCFIRQFPAKELWRRQFYEITEIRKITGSAVGRGVGKMVEGKMLEFAFWDGSVDQIEAVRKRDEAFNSIIGFSQLEWQALEPVAGRNKEEVEGDG